MNSSPAPSGNAAPARRLSLSNLLLLQVGGLIVLVCIAVAVLANAYHAHNNEQLSEQRLHDVTGRIQTAIDLHLNQMTSTLELTRRNALRVVQGQRELDAVGGLYTELQTVVQNSKVVPYVYVGTAQGEFLSLERLPDGSVQRKVLLAGQKVRMNYVDPSAAVRTTLGTPEERPYDVKTRPWFKLAQATGRTGWTAPYHSFSRNKLQVTLAVPLMQEDGKLLGVLSADYDFLRLAKFMEDLPLPKGGVAFLIEADGKVLATSTQDNPHTGQVNEQRVTLAQSTTPALRAAAQLTNPAALADTTEQIRISHTKFGGDDFGVSLLKLPVPGTQPWYVGVSIKRDDLLSTVQRPIWVWSLLGGLLLVLLGSLALMSTRGIREQIQVLTQHAKLISNSDGFDASTITTGFESTPRSDEIAQLAQEMQSTALRMKEKSALQQSEKQQAQLRSAEFEAVLDQSADATAIFNAQGELLFANPAFWELTGLIKPNEPANSQAGPVLNLFERMHTSPEDASRNVFNNQAVRVFVHKRPNGERYMAECLVFPIALPGRDDQHFGLIERDVTHRYVAQQQMVKASTRDELTGLLNRPALMQYLMQALEHMTKQPEVAQGQLAVVYFDLNHFKQVNDQHGHPAGDRVLKQIADHVRDILPGDAHFARWGGDEFVIVLPHFESATHAQWVQQLEQACQLDFVSADHTIRLSAAIGLAIAPNDSYLPQQLIELADSRMYAAKAVYKHELELAQRGDQTLPP